MKEKTSLYALIFCYLVMAFTAFFFYPRWHKTRTEATIGWDVSGYYMYLPAFFIYKDIKKCSFKDEIMEKYYPTPDFQQAFLHEKSGNYVMKYSSGQAITMMPFFFIAHAYCTITASYPADGFSFPYQFCLGFGMLLYAFLGLFVLRKILRTFFSDTSVAVVLLCYVLGSNYLNYVAVDQAMTHNVLFTIYVLILYCTIQFYNKPNFKYAIFIGSLSGLATLIRPTDIISIMIPVLWNLHSVKEIKEKLAFVRQHFFKFSAMFAMIFVVFSIQMVYWKYVANEWLVYSYEDQGFSWMRPHVEDYAFSYQCGWLLYSPMMILPMLGAVYYFFKGTHPYAIVGFIFLNFYIVTAWDIWDYGGTAGRAMVQSYPVLAFPFALLIQQVGKVRWASVLIGLLILLFTYLNVWWIYHSHTGQIQTIGLTKAYYWKVIGRWHSEEEDLKYMDNPHVFEGIPNNPVSIFQTDFSQDTSANVFVVNEDKKIRVNKDLQFTEPLVIDKSDKIKGWVRVSADFHCTLKEWDLWRQAQWIIKFYQGDNEVQGNMIRLHRFIDNGQDKRLHIDAKTPNAAWDFVKVFVWNADGDKELWIDNVLVESFDE